MHPADGSMTSWYDDDERANLIAGCPFALLSNTWNDSMPEKLKISSGDSECQLGLYKEILRPVNVVDARNGLVFEIDCQSKPFAVEAENNHWGVDARITCRICETDLVNTTVEHEAGQRITDCGSRWRSQRPKRFLRSQKWGCCLNRKTGRMHPCRSQQNRRYCIWLALRGTAKP